MCKNLAIYGKGSVPKGVKEGAPHFEMNMGYVFFFFCDQHALTVRGWGSEKRRNGGG